KTMGKRKTENRIKILYHQIKPDVYKDGKKVRAGLDCPDGIAAAWVALKKYPTATLVGCSYESEPPQVNDGDKLIIVDFSFELSVINQWRDHSCEIILIDHHKTLVDKVHEHTTTILKLLLSSYLKSHKQQSLLAQININNNAVLRDFLEFAKLTNFWKDIKNATIEEVTLLESYISKFCRATSINRLFKYFSQGDLTFDINKCGAVLTWEYFFPNEPVPAFLLYIQDRDLWQWLQPKSKEINEAFGHIRFGATRNQILDEMDRFYPMSQADLIYQFEALGKMLRAPKQEQSQLLAKKSHWVEAWGYKFIAVPLDQNDAFYYNEVLEILYTENANSPFVCSYIKRDNDYKLSFRSKQQYNSFDVSKLARSLSGGGHETAAGCILSDLPWIEQKVMV
ncbi:MAG: DHHA1 domain-containing protein, partial [Sphaerospermopsis kisseleviana]